MRVNLFEYLNWAGSFKVGEENWSECERDGVGSCLKRLLSKGRILWKPKPKKVDLKRWINITKSNQHVQRIHQTSTQDWVRK